MVSKNKESTMWLVNGPWKTVSHAGGARAKQGEGV